MSWQASEWAMAQSAGSSRAKLVLLVLAEAASAQGVTLIGIETVARRAELGERTVWSALQELAAGDAPLITRRRRLDGKGHRTSDEITLNMAPVLVANDASGGAIQVADIATRGGALLATCDTPYSQSTTVPTRKDCDGTGQKNRSEEPVRLLESGSKPLSPSRRKPETSLPDDFPAELTLVSAPERRPRRWRFCPESWTPSDGHRRRALEAGLSEHDFENEVRRFRNHEFAAPKSDPDRAFANWLDRARPSRATPSGGPPSGTQWAMEGLE